MLPGYVVPGQFISPPNPALLAGAGVESQKYGLTASVLGKVSLISENGKQRVSVLNAFQNPYVSHNPFHNSRRSISQLPQVGDVVYAHVLRLGTQQVVLEILTVEGRGNTEADAGIGSQASALGSVHTSGARSSELNELGEGYGAAIRVQDIRATERDKLKMSDCFRPGDIVRAAVLSIGDGQNYYLTTARNDLGVVLATDPASGVQLVPADWQHILNPLTGELKSRKCANPFV